jgi:hypothetical protein
MRALVIAGVLLAASIGTAHADNVGAATVDRKACIRDMHELYGDLRSAGIDVKRQCDPKNFVTNPNEYGWVCQSEDVKRIKGHGAKQQKDALCD